MIRFSNLLEISGMVKRRLQFEQRRHKVKKNDCLACFSIAHSLGVKYRIKITMKEMKESFFLEMQNTYRIF